MKTAAFIAGMVGILLNLLVYQQKKSENILLFKLLSDIVWAIQYLLLGAYTGFCIGCIATVRETVFYRVDRKSRMGRLCLIIFTVVSVISVIFTWRSITSILPAAASILSVFSFFFAIPRLSRGLAFPISICMGIYSFSVDSFWGVSNEIITLISVIVGIVRIDLNRSKKLRISAINWDCSLPSDTYFGFYQTRTLSPKKHRTATPYYADIRGENKIEYHLRTQKEFDRELRYAIKAGIDYFSYVFYPTKGSEMHICSSDSDCSHKVYELNYARKMHEKSRLKSKIKIAAIMGAHPFEEEDLSELATLLGQPYYEKLDGRPIVYLFNRINKDDINGLKGAVARLGGEPPLFVAMLSDPPENADYGLVDGISAYTCTKNGITRYEELLDAAMNENKKRAEKVSFSVPLFTVGWDPSPRIDVPSPWVKYADTEYAKTASVQELIEGGKRFAVHIKEHLAEGFSGHIMTFAWNEFEEGGWLCPTYNEDLSVNKERVKAFSKITKHWKKHFFENL